MKIAIIEDEKLTAEDLAATIKKIQPGTEIVAMLYSVKESIAYFKDAPHEVDLLFSDIQLGDGTSFDLFSQVNINTPVIFCTAYDEYALDAFRANGIDYILKPFTDDMILTALNKYESLKERMLTASTPSLEEVLKLVAAKKSDGPGAILVYHKDKILPVAFKDIAFFYFKNGAAHLSTFDKKSYYLNKSLDELEKTAGTAFYRVNRQYLINRKAVQEVSSLMARKLSISLIVPTEEAVLVSKEKMPQFLHWLTLSE